MKTMMIMVIGFFSGLLSFLISKNYLLMMLLSLEYMMLFLGFMMSIFLNFSSNFELLIFFLVMVVSEGVVGISLLISMIRSFSSDYFMLLNILW